MSGTGHTRLEQLAHEPITIVPYDAEWPLRFAMEEELLRAVLPTALYSRIDHIGSTAVPGLSAKPVIDIQVQVASLERVRREAVPLLEALDYAFIWRPSMGERASHYAWFIKRNPEGQRTFHVHMVEPDEATVDRLLFRDRLRQDARLAERYERLKQELAVRYPGDRVAYTAAKTPFIREVLGRS